MTRIGRRLGGLLVALVGLVALAGQPAAAATADITVEYFWGDGCPYCAQQAVFFEQLTADFPQVVIEDYEVWNDAANREVFQQTARAHGVEASAVPMTFLDGQVWTGYDDRIGAEIRAAVAALAAGPAGPVAPSDPEPPARTVSLPFVGTVEVENASLVVATVAIGLVDGVNPCSLWALSILLALVVRTGSRTRIAAVGGTFLVVTATIYGAFVLGLYSGLAFVSHVGWVTAVVATAALIFGVLSVKEFFWFRKGPSLTISNRRKPALYERMRSVTLGRKTLAGALVGTVALAAGVAVLELPCTAGLPMLWANLVSSAGLELPATVALLGLYLLMYLLDELIIVGVVVVAMRVAKLQERHGQALKLVSGWLMITLAGALIVAPDALQTLTGMLVVLLVAAGLVGATWLYRRWFAPPPPPPPPPTDRPRRPGRAGQPGRNKQPAGRG